MGVLGYMIILFLKEPHTILHRGYTNLHSHYCPAGITIVILQRRKLNLKDTVALRGHSGRKWQQDWNPSTQILRPTTFFYKFYSFMRFSFLFLTVNKC